MLTLGSQKAYAISLMFIIFFSFLLLVAKRQHKEYWSALNNAKLLDPRAQELENSNRELESYSYSIAHDLRAPLRSITSYSQILLAEAAIKLNAEEIDSLNRVVNSGKHMAELIDDILELSRITRGDLHKDTVDLSKLANECADQLIKQEPNYNVKWTIEPNLITKGDSQLLNVAMQNLIGNSWKFTHRLSKTAEIQFGSEIKQNKVIYYVKDNGIGFDMTYSNRIFNPFERLHKDYDGTGIGLATVARVIHRHGGDIWVESESNKGSIFYFTL
jgi:light-regulated signal transduction histidine kinase (bacteriophytochrome)